MDGSIRVSRWLLIALLLLMGLLFGHSPSAAALPYGSGKYNVNCYSADCSTAGGVTGTTNATTAGAPSTGLERTSLVWAGVAGFVGFSIISFVVIRSFNINRANRSQ